MRTDAQNALSEAQAVTTAAASTSCIKMGTNGGKGRPTVFEFRVDTTFATGAGATTLTVTLQSCATSDGSYADIPGASSGAIPIASLVAGYMFRLVLPNVHAAYVQAYYTPDAAFNAGKIDCRVIEGEQSNLTH